MVKLISENKIEYNVALKNVVKSKIIKETLLDDTTFESLTEEEIAEYELEEVPVQVNSKQLEQVVKFLEIDDILPTIEQPLKEDDISKIVPKVFYDFAVSNINKVDPTESQGAPCGAKYTDIIELIKAANYLIVDDLLQLLAAFIASTVKGKSPEEIAEFYGIANPKSESVGAK
jgi:hypothetical protein